jgi:hypothetical protein
MYRKLIRREAIWFELMTTPDDSFVLDTKYSHKSCEFHADINSRNHEDFYILEANHLAE